MIRPSWRYGGISLPPLKSQYEITPKIGSESRHHEPYSSPLAHIYQERSYCGYTINRRDEYMVPPMYQNNPHFPAASGHTEKLGSGSCNTKGGMADRISKKTWEENISEEKFLQSREKIRKLIESEYKNSKIYLY